MATKSINSLIIDAAKKYIDGDTSVFNAETSAGIEVNDSSGNHVLTLAGDGAAIELADFAGEIDAIVGFTPTGSSFFDQRAFADIIRRGEPARSYYSEAASATRGSRKEMPLVGAVYWSADTVAIVDMEGGQPELWMVFEGEAGKLLNSADGFATTAIADVRMRFGVLAVGNAVTTVGDISIIDFIDDGGARISNSALRSAPHSIAQRNETLGQGPIVQSIGIVNRSVNAVAISDPLDHYPLDEYGRPAFAIAAATGGGVSVILPDADNRGKRVTDSAVATFVGFVDWTPDGRLAYYRSTSARYTYLEPLSSIEAGDSWNAGHLFGTAEGNALDADSTALVGVNQGYARGVVSNGVELLKSTYLSTTTPLRALLSSTSLSGWMPGDCKLALDFNAYAAGSVAASTPLDDDFSSYADTAALLVNWPEVSGGVTTLDAAALLVTLDTGDTFGGSSRAVTTVAGETYVVEAELVSVSSAAAVNIGTATNTSNLAATSSLSSAGVYYLTFTATSTTSYITVAAAGAATDTAKFDNITVKRAYPDLSPADNGAIINGTLTAAAVETGADLFALSGWSTSNYLEVPYSSDFDMGTGDFAAFAWVKITSAPGTSATVFERDSGTSAENYGLLVLSSGAVRALADDDVTVYAADGFTNIVGSWALIGIVRRGNTLEVVVNGAVEATDDISAMGSLDNASGVIRFGRQVDQIVPFDNGSITLPRIIKGYAPTPEQIRQMYRDEAPLFRENAECFLPSDTVNALDADKGLLLIGTEAGAVLHRGFERLELLDSGDIGLTESGIDAVSLLGGDNVALTSGTESVVRIASRNLADAQVIDAYSYERDFAGKGYTTNATPLDIAKLPIAEGEIIEWRGSITARSDDGTERASYTRVVRAYRDVNGNATLAGADTLGTDDETTAGMDVAFAADTTAQTIDLQVTGVASTNIQWAFDGTLVVNKQ